MQQFLSRELRSYYKRLWAGKFTSGENIGFFVPVWLWFAGVVFIELRGLSARPLLLTFFVVFALSTVPFFRRRIGFLRFGILGWLLPAAIATFVLAFLK